MMGGRTFEFRICVLLDVVLKPKMQISFFYVSAMATAILLLLAARLIFLLLL